MTKCGHGHARRWWIKNQTENLTRAAETLKRIKMNEPLPGWMSLNDKSWRQKWRAFMSQVSSDMYYTGLKYKLSRNNVWAIQRECITKQGEQNA